MAEVVESSLKAQRDPQAVALENSQAQDLGAEGEQRTFPRAEQPRADDRTDDDDIEQRPNQSQRFQSKRSDIFARARELRAEQANPELADEVAASRQRRFGDNVQQPDIKADAQAQQQEPPAAPKTRRIKVHDRDVELTEEQYEAAASRALAADDILEQAKRIRREAGDEARTILEAARAGKPTAEPSEPPANPTPAESKLPKDVLAEIADHMQVGNHEEAQAALEKYGDLIVDRATKQIDQRIAERVESVNDGNARRRQADETLGTFYADAPEYKTSRAAAAGLAVHTAETMRSAILERGGDEALFEHIRANVRHSDGRPLTELEVVGEVFAQQERAGMQLPSRLDVLRAADAAYRKDVGLPPRQARQQQQEPPQPANRNFDPADRLERKREIVPQPRRASATPSHETQELTRDEKRLDAVRGMRAYRRGR